MFKKLLTLAAVALCAYSVNAEEVVDKYIDYTTTPWSGYVMGYIPQSTADGIVFAWPNYTYADIEDDGVNPNGYEIVNFNGADHYVVPTEDGGPREDWGIQAHLTGNFDTQVGTDYKLTICAKATQECSVGVPCSWGWGDGQGISGNAAIGTDWTEVEVNYLEVGGNPCWIVLQLYSGDKDAVVTVKWVKVTHDEKPSTTEWIQLVENGDAEGEYGEVPCAYSKEYGYNNNEPHPAFIESVGGENVFVCHATEKVDQAWDNQFWIVSPQTFSKDQSFRLNFDYKAAKPATGIASQNHAAPGSYLHWAGLGSFDFTTDWQHYGKIVSVPTEADGMYSIAFNLNDYADANDYYFDNISIEVMKLDEGWFVAGDFQEGGKEKLAEAVEFKYNEDEFTYEATVGTDEMPASVLKISTRRGDDQAYNANTIKVDVPETLDGTDENAWLNFEFSSAKKINLPFAGCWAIAIDEDFGQVRFLTGTPGGINGVEFDNNAPVEYYNIQGMKVNNVVPGQVYIVRQGKSVAKTIVR